MSEEMNYTNNEETTMVSTETHEEPYRETETSSGSSTVAKIVIGLAATAVGTGIAFGWNKLKKHNEDKTIERLKKKGYTITEPETKTEEAEVVEGEVINEEDVAGEPEKEAK